MAADIFNDSIITDLVICNAELFQLCKSIECLDTFNLVIIQIQLLKIGQILNRRYIADIIIAIIVYLSAFSMFIKQLLNGRSKKKGGNK